jgi:flotillin
LGSRGKSGLTRAASYNANVKELQDTAGSEYFKFLSRKAHEGASNQAKVDVATARMIGEIGEAEKRGKTRQEISKIDAQTAVLETQRKSEKATADAELATTQTKLDMNIQMAKITANRQAEAKDAELQKLVETKRAEMELERRRATDVVNAKIEKESTQQKADAKLYSDQKGADGQFYKYKQDAEAACQ